MNINFFMIIVFVLKLVSDWKIREWTVQPSCIHSGTGSMAAFGGCRSGKNKRWRAKPCGTCNERAMKRFQVDELLPYTCFFG